MINCKGCLFFAELKKLKKVDKNIVLEGKRVLLRPPNFSDCEIIVHWRNLPRVKTFHLDIKPLTLKAQKEYLKKYFKKENDIYFVIVVKKENRMIGTVALYNIAEKKAELGRLLIGEEKYLGKGYMKDAIVVLLQYAFMTLTIEEVYLGTFFENEEALSLYNKIGFQVRERNRLYFPSGDCYYTQIYMKLDKRIFYEALILHQTG